MNVQEIDVSLIRPNDYNPNAMDEKKLQVLKNNIEKKGFLQPILVREDAENKG